MNIENRCEGFTEIGFGDFHPYGVDMGTNEVAIPQINAGRDDRASNHPIGVFEVILIVRAATGAVGINQRGLSTTTGAATALRVVGRGRRDVAKIDDVKLGDVHAEFHRWGTEQQRQFRSTKAIFAFLAVFGRHLSGVLAGFQHTFQVNETAIAFHEVLVHLGRNFSGVEQTRAIHGAHLAGIRQPSESVVIDLVTWHVATAHLFDNAVTFESEEEEADAGVHFRATERFIRLRMGQQRPAQITPETSV